MSASAKFRLAHFTDEMIDAVLSGARALTADERAFLIEDTPSFEECGERLAYELPNMLDADLMRAARDVWSDYASGQI